MSKDKRLLHRYYSTNLFATNNYKQFEIRNSTTDLRLNFGIDAVIELKQFFEEYFGKGNYCGALRFGHLGRFVSFDEELYKKYMTLINNHKITSNYICSGDYKGIMRSLNYILKNYKPDGQKCKESITSIIKEIKLMNNKEEVV